MGAALDGGVARHAVPSLSLSLTASLSLSFSLCPAVCPHFCATFFWLPTENPKVLHTFRLRLSACPPLYPSLTAPISLPFFLQCKKHFGTAFRSFSAHFFMGFFLRFIGFAFIVVFCCVCVCECVCTVFP